MFRYMITIFSLFLLVTLLVTSSPPAATNPLDGCVYLYLDMGTNIGVQIRKLFEPEKFPHSPVQDVFRKYFFSHNNSREIQPSEVVLSQQNIPIVYSSSRYSRCVSWYFNNKVIVLYIYYSQIEHWTCKYYFRCVLWAGSQTPGWQIIWRD